MTVTHPTAVISLHPALRHAGRVMLLTGAIHDLFVPFANAPFTAPLNAALDDIGYPRVSVTASTEIHLALQGHPTCTILLDRTEPLTDADIAAIRRAAAIDDEASAMRECQELQARIDVLSAQMRSLTIAAEGAARCASKARAFLDTTA